MATRILPTIPSKPVDPEEETGADVLPDEIVDEERMVRSHPGDDEDDATHRRDAGAGKNKSR